MIWWTILMCAQKLMCSQLSLPHGNQTKKNNEETKNIKRRCSEETVQSWSPWSQSWGWKGVYGGKDLWKRCFKEHIHAKFNKSYTMLGFTIPSLMLLITWQYKSHSCKSCSCMQDASNWSVTDLNSNSLSLAVWCKLFDLAMNVMSRNFSAFSANSSADLCMASMSF